MQDSFKRRFLQMAIMGAAFVAAVVLTPGTSPRWDSVLTEMAGRQSDRIIHAKGANKHVPGIEYFYMSRKYGNPGINVEMKRLEARAEVESRLGKGLDKTAMSNEWTALGPANTAGRLRALAFRPGDYNVVYAGGASGGVFKSDQGGQGGSWRPVMDYADAIPVGALAVDPSNPDVVYAGTGEPTMELTKSYGAPSYSGVGVMKSTDAGETWRRLPWPTSSSAIHAIIVDPRNSGLVFAATRDGLYRSADAGESWARVQSGVVTDVVFREDNPDIVIAAIGNDNGGSLNGIYRSTNGGQRFSWAKVAGNWPLPDSTGRIELATTPANPNLLMAFVMRSRDTQSGENDFLAVMKSTDNGDNWQRVQSNLPSDYTSGQGFYNLCAAISPVDPNLIVTGGFEVYKSTTGGTSWSRVTNGNSPVHVDQHVLRFTEDGKYLYLGNDGGAYRSANGGSSWTPLGDGLETIQFYSLAWDPNDAERFYGGAQDHGIFQTFNVNIKSWRLRRGGDGGYILVDPKRSNVLYSRVAVEGGSIAVPSRSVDGGSSWTRLANGFGSIEADRFNWLPPMMLSPNDNTRMYTATQFVYTAKGVDTGSPTWAPISPDITGRSSYAYSVVSTMDICESSPTWMYVGSGDGTVQYSDVINALDVEWFNITAGLPNRWVSRIKVDRRNPEIAYVAFSGYGTGHMFKTTNKGAQWTDISGNLPDLPINSMVISRDDPDKTLFAATDFGVWYTRDAGQTWARFGDKLPNVVVYDIDIDSHNRLIAATHGRGMWITDATLDIDPSAPAAAGFAVMQNYPNPLQASAGTRIRFSLDAPATISMKLYDATGRLLRTLAEGRHDAGSHDLTVNTVDLRNGVYFYTISNGRENVTQKMVVMN
ncbi:MAG: T9SS type A sorting domain-containing protein [Bacteroidetes bacterium]|nr:T9SS type A sorting domain-containing protein [Bacteroidota bacterium]